MTRLHAVAVTFNRPEILDATLETVLAQSVVVESLVIVDNGSARPADLVCASRKGIRLSSGTNIGPAGGFARGVEYLLARGDVSDSDWILFVDDDDPLHSNDEVAKLLAFAQIQIEAGRDVGAVGRCGVRLAWHGRLQRIPDDDLVGAVAVQAIGNGQAALYRVGALRKVSWTFSSLFFGYEELALGLALEKAGYELLVPGEPWRKLRSTYGVLGMDARGAQLGRDPHPWRRYYSVRNLVRIVREHRGEIAAINATLFALAGSVRSGARKGTPDPIVAALRGAFDGWRGLGGLTVQPRDQKLS